MERPEELKASQKSIKEISEILEGVKVVGVATAKILADGKVNLADVPAIMELAKEHQVLVDAVQGASGAIPEAKDLDMGELAVIGAKALEIAKAIKAAHS